MKHAVSHFYHIPKLLKNDFPDKVQTSTFLPEYSCLSFRAESGGAKEDRTPDLLRAKQALSQLSYGPNVGRPYAPRQLVGLGRFELPTSPLSGVRSNQLSYRPNRLSQLNQAIRVGAYEEAEVFD